jgi:hypothetical protein
MTTTQRVQLESGLIALIGPGYRPTCDHDTCHEAAHLGHLDGTDCPVDNGYLHVMIGPEAPNGGIYIDNAVNATITPDAADEFAKALTERAVKARRIAEHTTPRTPEATR